MTGVGYAAPVLFEVFGLLPKGEWFAEPVGDLEPAVVCRQSRTWLRISVLTAIR